MKNKITTVVFSAILFGLFIASIIKPNQELSYSERRRLAQFPTISVKSVFDASFMKGLDKYTADQFIFREQFRGIKAFVDRNVFMKLDTNGLFRAEGGVFSIEYPLHEDKVTSLCGKMNNLYERYLTGMNVYYSIVPDKNYYLPNDGRYLLMDYEKLAALMQQNMPEAMRYIDVFDTLSLSSYYNTDGHWRQEALAPVISAICSGMGVPDKFDISAYTQTEYEPFYGAYYGQSAGMLTPDTLIYLENEATKNTLVEIPGRENSSVYYTDGLGGMDSYDVYLYGMQPIITLTNPLNDSGRELILVRDSYGSSLAPLLLESYSKITLIDLRYVTQELLADYVEFDDQDVLIMYSTTIINNSDIIR